MSLFPPPKDIETEVWSELPDEFRRKGDATRSVSLLSEGFGR